LNAANLVLGIAVSRDDFLVQSFDPEKAPTCAREHLQTTPEHRHCPLCGGRFLHRPTISGRPAFAAMAESRGVSPLVAWEQLQAGSGRLRVFTTANAGTLVFGTSVWSADRGDDDVFDCIEFDGNDLAARAAEIRAVATEIGVPEDRKVLLYACT